MEHGRIRSRGIFPGTKEGREQRGSGINEGGGPVMYSGEYEFFLGLFEATFGPIADRRGRRIGVIGLFYSGFYPASGPLDGRIEFLRFGATTGIMSPYLASPGP